MKATVEFDLPDDEYNFFKCAIYGTKLLGVIRELDEELRKIIKYNPGRFNSPVEALQYIRSVLHQELEEEGINIDQFSS